MIYISVGTNLGDRLSNLRKAVALLKERFFPRLEVSIILETPAILPEKAPKDWDKPYLNMVVRGESHLKPEDLLKGLKEIERAMGRPEVYEKWAPRLIDLDLLVFDELHLNTATLTIPHPELLNRSFLVHLIALMDPLRRYQAPSPSQPEHIYHNKTFGEIAYLSKEINHCFTKSFVLDPKLVGIVNVTPDSFSDGGKNFDSNTALDTIQQMCQDGASVIEIGGQSTRPGAMMVGDKEEYARLEPVLEKLSERIKKKEICVSLDSFSSDVILKVLDRYPIAWVNDVKGDLDNATLKKMADKGVKIVVMHSLGIPPKKNQCLDFEIPPIASICHWADNTVARLKQCGFKESTIILDPGIGFGKTPYQNLSLLQNIKELKQFGCEVLVGHSRKSFMAAFSKVGTEDRDLESIAISSALASQAVDYLRVHNVSDHQRFFVSLALSTLRPSHRSE